MKWKWDRDKIRILLSQFKGENGGFDLGDNFLADLFSGAVQDQDYEIAFMIKEEMKRREGYDHPMNIDEVFYVPESIDGMQQMLNWAVENEKYELAAAMRDRIAKMNKTTA
jgi:excinuclease UvrABC helicase subunit UvrB